MFEYEMQDTRRLSRVIGSENRDDLYSPIQRSLVRGISKWGLASVMFNSIIGASVFGLPSATYRLANSYSLVALGACSVLICFIIICFAEVSSRFREAGGSYVYARSAFGPLIGFEVGWLTWLTRVLGFAAVCNLFVTYVARLSPLNTVSAPERVAIIVGLVALLTIVNLIGVRETSLTSALLAIGKLTFFLSFIAIGLCYVNWSNISFAVAPSHADFSTTVVLFIFSFGGFEGATIVAGEVRNARRVYPFALLVVTVTVALIYMLAQLVCIGTLPGLADHESALADSTASFAGTTGATIISIGALLSMLGTLNAGLLGLTRMPFALAEHGALPRVFGAIHRHSRTPYFSITMSSVVILVLALSSSFVSAVKIAALTRLIVYAVTRASLPVLRRKQNQPALFKAPFGITISLVSLAICAWLITRTSWRELRDSAIAVAIGLILHLIINRKQNRQVNAKPVA